MESLRERFNYKENRIQEQICAIPATILGRALMRS
jgi:hypothetical protein